MKLVEKADATPEVQKVYDEVRKTFGVPFFPNIFKAMANHPGYLEVTGKKGTFPFFLPYEFG